jgi:hypothetical protein
LTGESVGIDVFSSSSAVMTNNTDVSAQIGYRFDSDTHSMVWKNADCFITKTCILDKSHSGVRQC